MVIGLDKFQEYFATYEDSYIIIGGTACDMLEENAGLNPRATKDIDIILIIEALTSSFAQRFWDFIQAGAYETRQRSNGKQEYFRFLKPYTPGFPQQIELFARQPDLFQMAENSLLTPIPLDEDISSLSAILMDDAYYHFTIEHSAIENGIHLANSEALICLKAKAFLDLSERKNTGASIDEKNIRKHKNDIFRLTVMLHPDMEISLPVPIQNDIQNFCIQIGNTLPDKNIFKELGIGNIDPHFVFERLRALFQIKI